MHGTDLPTRRVRQLFDRTDTRRQALLSALATVAKQRNELLLRPTQTPISQASTPSRTSELEPLQRAVLLRQPLGGRRAGVLCQRHHPCRLRAEARQQLQRHVDARPSAAPRLCLLPPLLQLPTRCGRSRCPVVRTGMQQLLQLLQSLSTAERRCWLLGNCRQAVRRQGRRCRQEAVAQTSADGAQVFPCKMKNSTTSISSNESLRLPNGK